MPEQDLQVISESGVAPSTRVASASAARNIYTKLLEEDKTRAAGRAKLLGMVDGNPPYSVSELKRLGQSFRCNVNFKEAKGYLKARQASFFELLLEVPKIATIKFETASMPKPVQDKDTFDFHRRNWEEIISEEFDHLLKDWDQFYFNMQSHQWQMLMYGIGPVFFPHPVDWKFKATPMGSLLYPSKVKVSGEGLEVSALKHSYSATELYALIKTPEEEEIAKNLGWNIEVLKELVYKAHDRTNTADYTTSMWETMQQSVKNNDLAYAYSHGMTAIPVAFMFWKEFDGSVTMAIIDIVEDRKEFLYLKRGAYKEFSEIFTLFYTEIGDGTYHSIRGLAYDIYAHCDINNRFLNVLVDGGMLSASLLLKNNMAGGHSKPRMLRMGPISILPNGYEPVQANFAPNMQGVAGIRTILQQNLNSNVGLYRPDSSSIAKPGPGKTAKEATIQAMKEAKLEKADVNLYYTQADKLYSEVLKRLVNKDYSKYDPGYQERKEFIDACVRRGVPKKYLDEEYLKATANRAIGYGSPIMKEINSEKLLAIAPMLDEKGKKEAVKNRVRALVGERNLEAYIGEAADNVPTIDATIAQLENNWLSMQKKVVAGIEEQHIVHIKAHLKPLLELGQQFQANPQAFANAKVTPILQQLILAREHIVEHIKFIADNPLYQSEVKQYVALMDKLDELIKQLAKDAKKEQEQEQAQQQQAQQQQQQQAQAQSEAEVKKFDIQKEYELKAIKEIHNDEVRKAKAVHGMQIKNAQVAEAQRLKQEQADFNQHLQLQNQQSKGGNK